VDALPHPRTFQRGHRPLRLVNPAVKVAHAGAVAPHPLEHLAAVAPLLLA
jgi:hypothetical protein